VKKNRDYEKYLEIMDKQINVNWNFRNVYEKIVDEIIEKYEKEKIKSGNTDEIIRNKLIENIYRINDLRVINFIYELSLLNCLPIEEKESF